MIKISEIGHCRLGIVNNSFKQPRGRGFESTWIPRAREQIHNCLEVIRIHSLRQENLLQYQKGIKIIYIKADEAFSNLISITYNI